MFCFSVESFIGELERLNPLVHRWDSVHRILPKDVAGNASVGEVVLEECRGCLGVSSARRLIMIGFEDVVAVESEEAVLAIRRELSQQVRSVGEA